MFVHSNEYSCSCEGGNVTTTAKQKLPTNSNSSAHSMLEASPLKLFTVEDDCE